jgi:beta-lactamase class A
MTTRLLIDRKARLARRRTLAAVLATAFIALAPAGRAAAQTPTLDSQLAAIAARADGQVGMAVRDLETGQQVLVNGRARFPMQSVFKFPLALAVLHRVDRGEFTLDQVVHISREQLLPGTWSPIRDAHPDASVDLTLADLLRFVVSQSDNNGCDALFRLMGGTAAVDREVRQLGGRDFAIAATEEEMHRDWQVQFRNWAQPEALVDLLERFDRRHILSETSRAFLWKAMVETTTGPGRLKGRLSKDVIVAHKTGASGKNERGVSAAVNDIGILVLPNGRHIAIAVLVTGATAADEASERVIADVARAVVDYALASGGLR